VASRAVEDGVEHRRGESLRERVLLARMERPDQQAVADRDLGGVPEARTRAGHRLAGLIEDPEDGAPGERAEDDQDPGRVEDLELAGEERRARVALLDRRLVQRRCAADGGGDAGAGERQAVVRAAARRPVRDPRPMQCGPQEVAARVAGEDPPGPVAAVGCRREPDDEDPRVGIAEAGERPAPVRLVAVAGDLLPGDLFPPRDEPRTAPALDDLALELGERDPPPLPGRFAYLSSSLSSRRDTISSPPRPMRPRYATWTRSPGPMIPRASDRMRSTPWYSGVS
jgi:hypothetical protein